MVLIFPRVTYAGGTVDPAQEVPDPWASLEKIFVATANKHSAYSCERVKARIGPGPLLLLLFVLYFPYVVVSN